MSTSDQHSADHYRDQRGGPQPGWYPDGTGGQRWWDGVQWTGHYQPGMPLVQQPRRRTGVMIGAISAAVLLIGGGIGLAIWLSQPGDSESDGARPKPAPTVNGQTPTPSPPVDLLPIEEETDASAGGMLDYDKVFAERDEFFEAQQLPLGSNNLSAVTDEQHAFIDEMQAYYESEGFCWNAEMESTVLALALNGCESSILNGHQLDEFAVQTYALSSPLIAELTQGTSEADRITYTGNLMDVVVTGTYYLCPADHDQWKMYVEQIGDNW